MDWPTVVTSAVTSLVVAGGGGAAIAVGIGKFMGEKWIEARFSQSLETLRHEQTKEIERVKFAVAGILDRSSRLNQREFEVLPGVWHSLDEAYVKCANALRQFRMYADMSKLGEDEAREFLETTELPVFFRQEIMELPVGDRTHGYTERMRRYEAHVAEQSAREAFKQLRRDGIFLEKETYARIDRFLETLMAVATSHNLNIRWPREDRDLANQDWFHNESDKEHKELLNFLHDRFWNTSENIRSAFGVSTNET